MENPVFGDYLNVMSCGYCLAVSLPFRFGFCVACQDSRVMQNLCDSIFASDFVEFCNLFSWHKQQERGSSITNRILWMYS